MRLVQCCRLSSDAIPSARSAGRAPAGLNQGHAPLGKLCSAQRWLLLGACIRSTKRCSPCICRSSACLTRDGRHERVIQVRQLGEGPGQVGQVLLAAGQAGRRRQAAWSAIARKHAVHSLLRSKQSPCTCSKRTLQPTAPRPPPELVDAPRCLRRHRVHQCAVVVAQPCKCPHCGPSTEAGFS
jgi:hypothetical protein